MKTKVKREWRLRKRVLAWQQQHLGHLDCGGAPGPQSAGDGFTLAQRLEQHPKKTPASPSDHPWPPSPCSFALASGSQVLFRAGQIWRRPDKEAEFFVDFSDGEQVEIRWLWNQQWGEPHIMEVADLLTYVRAKNLRADWPGAAR